MQVVQIASKSRFANMGIVAQPQFFLNCQGVQPKVFLNAILEIVKAIQLIQLCLFNYILNMKLEMDGKVYLLLFLLLTIQRDPINVLFQNGLTLMIQTMKVPMKQLAIHL